MTNENKVGEQVVNLKEREKENSRLILLTKWNEYYDYPTLGALRSLVFNEKTNGFNKVVRRIGSRILLKEDAFFEWVEEINGMTA